MADRQSRTWLYVTIAGITAMVLLRLLMISVPLERDEGGYAYIADRWLQGEAPYVHALETKPPGVFAAYALILKFGRSVEAIRFASLLIALLTALMFYRLVGKTYGERAAALGTVMLALMQCAPPYIGYSANAEMFMVPLLVGAMFCLPLGGQTRRFWHYLLCGTLLGAAAITKPVALTEGLPVAVVVLLQNVTWRKKLADLVLIGVGFLMPVLVFYQVFAAMDAEGEMLFWAFIYNINYASSLTFIERIAALLSRIFLRDMALRDWPIWLAAIVGVVHLLKKRQDRLWMLFPLTWAVSSFVGVSGSGRYTGHYWQQWLPAICLLAAIGADNLFDWIAARNLEPRSARALTGLLLVLLLVYPTAVHTHYYFAGRDLARQIYGLNPFMEGELIGNYLKLHSQPDEKVFVLGTEPQFLYFSQRESATRFVFTYPLGSEHPLALLWQKETFDEVARKQPRYVVAVYITASFFLTDKAPKYLHEMTMRMLSQDYIREASLVGLDKRHTAFVTDNLPPLDGKTMVVLDLFRRKD